MEELVSNKPSTQKIEWTPELKKKFEQSKVEAKQLDEVYLPKPEDQLILSSDYSKLGISATLWALVDTKFLVVARMSAKLQKNQQDLFPCDGEATAQFVAAKCLQFSLPIKAANKKTNLLTKGKFSSSKIINNVFTSISDL